MNADLVIGTLRRMSSDKRVNVWHVDFYCAALQLWHNNGSKNPVPVSRRKILEVSHIRNIVTYHKCLRELEQFGYIRYEPSYHPHKGSMMHLLLLDTV